MLHMQKWGVMCKVWWSNDQLYQEAGYCSIPLITLGSTLNGHKITELCQRLLVVISNDVFYIGTS